MATSSDLTRLLHDYGAGLRAEVTLLGELRQLSEAEQRASDAGDLDTVQRLVEAREHVLGGLLDLESRLRPWRSTLAQHVDDARRLPAFASVSALHRDADALVTAIVQGDESTLHALRHAESVRRQAVQTLEAGEATLAAYRRVVSPTLVRSGLIDEQG